RRRQRLDVGPPARGEAAAGAAGGGDVARGVRAVRGAAAGRNRRYRSCAKYADDVIPGGGFAVAGPSGSAARDRPPLSGAGGWLGAQDGKAGRCSLSRKQRTTRRRRASASRAELAGGWCR